MGRKKSRAAAASAAAPTAWLTTSARTTQQLPAHAPILPPGAEDATSFGAPLEAQVATLADDREGAAVIAARPALTPAEVDAWIAWGERTGFEPQKLARTAWSAHRDNGRLAIESETVAAAIFQRLRPLLPVELDGRRPTGCNPNIRLYRAEWRWHIVVLALLYPSRGWHQHSNAARISGNGARAAETGRRPQVQVRRRPALRPPRGPGVRARRRVRDGIYRPVLSLRRRGRGRRRNGLLFYAWRQRAGARIGATREGCRAAARARPAMSHARGRGCQKWGEVPASDGRRLRVKCLYCASLAV